MLEVRAASSSTTGGERRLGLDLVAVLDVSISMLKNDRLAKMKTAMDFVIKKLGPVDRLSVVTFSDHADKLCHLRSVTEAFRADLKARVDGLTVVGSTNIRDGLETGIKVLADRRITRGRVAGVFLLSDGDENIGHAAGVDVSHVAVYTFGFGADYDPKVLDEIARKSKGGTFSYVEDGENMTEPFSQILGGLLTVVVQDLKLTVSAPQPDDSVIEKVDSGLYLQTGDANSGPVIVSFGDLFAGEVRKVIIHIILLDVNRRKTAIAMVAHCSYSIQGKPFFSRELTVRIRRMETGSAASTMVPEAVRTELARRRHTIYLEEACAMADRQDMDGADKKLVEAKNDLKLEQQPNPIIDILRATLDKLLELVRLPGPRVAGFRAYLRSLRTSHERERVAATGDVKGARLFETHFTSKFRGQAEEFERRPTMELPPVEDDFEEQRQQEERPREKPPAVVGAWTWWGDGDEQQHRTRSSRARAMVILCTILAIAAIAVVAAVVVLAVIGHNRTPYLSVSDAQLGALQYAAQDGTIQNLQLSITILANNVKSKAEASFSSSSVDLALTLHGVDVALLRAPAFVVPPQSSTPLHYNEVASAGLALGPAAMRSMDESLRDGLVPLDLHGKVRTRWKGGGVFHRSHFWMRISCRLRFFFPGNGTVIPADRRRCRSRSP
uniref:Uncharacterized protein n=1 Tax=Avena sativa TaxID=4498 RepID=A0ACD5TDN5_AVESA